MNALRESEWLVSAVENWPVTLAISILVLAFFLWFLVPFAVFGVKRRLDRLTGLMERMVALLEKSEPDPSASAEKGLEKEDSEERSQS